MTTERPQPDPAMTNQVVPSGEWYAGRPRVIAYDVIGDVVEFLVGSDGQFSIRTNTAGGGDTWVAMDSRTTRELLKELLAQLNEIGQDA